MSTPHLHRVDEIVLLLLRDVHEGRPLDRQLVDSLTLDELDETIEMLTGFAVASLGLMHDGPDAALDRLAVILHAKHHA